MGRAGSPMTGRSLGEDRPFECAMKLDKMASEPADNTLAKALQVRLRHEGEGKEEMNGQRLTKYVSGSSCSCIRTMISSSCA